MCIPIYICACLCTNRFRLARPCPLLYFRLDAKANAARADTAFAEAGWPGATQAAVRLTPIYICTCVCVCVYGCAYSQETYHTHTHTSSGIYRLNAEATAARADTAFAEAGWARATQAAVDAAMYAEEAARAAASLAHKPRRQRALGWVSPQSVGGGYGGAGGESGSDESGDEVYICRRRRVHILLLL